jgi:hypothetical protein
MTTRHDPAFPSIDPADVEPQHVKRGYTKLEYAAIQIAAGMASNPCSDEGFSFKNIPHETVELANALFDALERVKG